MLTIGSLFTGAGMLDRAAEEVFDARTAWVSDIDKGACKVLAHRYPDAPNLGDITAIDWATVPRVDIITGGSPCQDLSHAGRRAGMTDGTRSNLWVAMREAIATIRPSFVVWENVAGALSATAESEEDRACSVEPGQGRVGGGAGRPNLRALGRVLGDLADLGFDAEWHGLPASDLGACHRRFRVFVLAYAPEQRHERPWGARDGRPGPAHGDRGALTLLPTPRATDGTKGGPNQRGSSGDLMLPSAVIQLTREESCSNGSGGAFAASFSTSTSGLSGGPAAVTAVGSSASQGLALLPTPSVADSMGGHERRGGARGGELLLKGIAKYELGPLLPTPTTTQRGTDANLDTREGARANLHNEVADAARWGEYAAAIARHERWTGQPAPEPTEPGAKGQPRLSARFVEWMMAQPPGWITDTPGVTRNEALKLCGNGVVTPQAAHALRVMLARLDLTGWRTA